MEYFDFIVEQKELDADEKPQANIYEQVLIATSRAKDLHEDKALTDARLEAHKITSAALYELQNKLINEHITEKEDLDIYSDLSSDFDDDELEEDL